MPEMPDKVVISCDICKQNIATAKLLDLKIPLTGAMFESVDEKHGFPRPFNVVATWVDLRCPVCFNRPFISGEKISSNIGEIILNTKGCEIVNKEEVIAPSEDDKDSDPEVGAEKREIPANDFDREVPSPSEVAEGGEVDQKIVDMINQSKDIG